MNGFRINAAHLAVTPETPERGKKNNFVMKTFFESVTAKIKTLYGLVTAGHGKTFVQNKTIIFLGN